MNNVIISKKEYKKRNRLFRIITVIGALLVLSSNTLMLHKYGLKAFGITTLSNLGSIMFIVGSFLILLWWVIWKAKGECLN